MDSTVHFVAANFLREGRQVGVAVMMRILLSALPVTGQSKANRSAKDEGDGGEAVLCNKRGIEISWNGPRTGERRARPSQKEIGKEIHCVFENRMDASPDDAKR